MAVITALLLPSAASAQVNLVFDSGGVTDYSPSTMSLKVDASALVIYDWANPVYDPYVGFLPNYQVLAATTEGGGLGLAQPCDPSALCGTLSIDARVDNLGRLISGTFVVTGKVVDYDTACVDFEFDPDLYLACLNGNPAQADGVLLSGVVRRFGAIDGSPVDFFEFDIEVTGGLLTGPSGLYSGKDLNVLVQSEEQAAFPNFIDDFTRSFRGGAKGDVTPMDKLICTGAIGDFVWHDANQNGIQDAGEAGIANVPVDLYMWNGASWDVYATGVNTNAAGNYVFGSLCPGTYRVDMTTPPTYLISPALQGGDAALDSNPNPFDVTLDFYDSVDLTVDFGFYAVPPRPFMTFTQGGWGSKPAGNNPGMLLATHFDQVYASGVAIGATVGSGCPAAPFKLTFAGAANVRAFLPQGGTPAALKLCQTDPTKKITVLAGQVLALTLNVDFSDAGVTQPGLASLAVASGPLAGRSVSQVLAVANCMLSGQTATACGAPGLTLSGINDVATKINENFDGGTADKGYLVH